MPRPAGAATIAGGSGGRMGDADGLLKAVFENPGDDAPRLVYADWCEECGDPDRAEFTRVQIELARMPDGDPRRPGPEDREHELLGAHESAWLGEWPDYAVDWRFERGFLAELRTSTSTLVEVGDDLFARHPLT